MTIEGKEKSAGYYAALYKNKIDPSGFAFFFQTRTFAGSVSQII
jgi:hypothetical protein